MNLDGLDAYLSSFRVSAAVTLAEEKVSITSQKRNLAAVLGWLSAISPFAFGAISIGGLLAISGAPIDPSMESSALLHGQRETIEIEEKIGAQESIRVHGTADKPILIVERELGRRIASLIAAVPRAPVVPMPPTNVRVEYQGIKLQRESGFSPGSLDDSESRCRWTGKRREQ